jgi:hypothetical protein
MLQNLTGHGFCESCTNRLFPTSGKTRCPNCRKFIHQRDGHPVYLQLVDSKLVFATKVIEGFGQMNTDTPVLSLKKASMKLGQVAKGNPDQAIVVGIFLCFLKLILTESHLHLIQTGTPSESN